MKKLYLIALMLVAVAAGAAEVKLHNPDFDMSNKGKLYWWIISHNDPAVGTAERVTLPNGRGAIKLTSTSGTKYFGIFQHVGVKIFPTLKAGEKIEMKMTWKQKNENVISGGFVNFSGYLSKGRFFDTDSPRTGGSFDWKEMSVVKVLDKVPADAKNFVIYLYLGKTTGSVYFAEPKLEINVIK